MVGIGLAVLLILAVPSAAGAKTLTRTCQGATLLRYEFQGKSYEELGHWAYRAEGSSSGVVPSPVKARRRACEKAAKAAGEHTSLHYAKKKICTKFGYGRGRITFLGGIGKAKDETQRFENGSYPVDLWCFDHEPGTMGCGDGVLDEFEDCDDGKYNSDTEPDACRTNCRAPGCGDSVADSGEQCDGEDLKLATCSSLDQNGNFTDSYYYWAGRLECTMDCEYDLSDCQFCGDGEVQSPPEQCDDGNEIDDDGCNTDCTACVSLAPDGQNLNIEVVSDTEICTHEYRADDYGKLGSIIVQAPNVVLDCDGARLTGQGDGIGIYVQRSDNVTITNCKLEHYDIGIYVEDSQNVGIQGLGNDFLETPEPVVLDNSTERPGPTPPPSRKPTRKPKRSRSTPRN